NSPAAGTNKPITVTYALTGADSANYQKPADSIATTTGEIVKKQLSVSGTTVASKNYDGTTTAVVSSQGTLGGVVVGDVVNFTAIGTYDTKDAGENKKVTVAYTLSGANKDNYLKPADETLSATIQPKQLSITKTTVATSKVYDGTTTAVVTAPRIPVGVIGSEDVSVTAAATYSDKTAGTGKQITVVYTLSGANADNYLAPTNAALTGTIQKKLLTATNIGVTDNKEYDGTGNATITACTINGIVDADSITVQKTATYNSPAAGTNKPITVTYALTGADSANYQKPADSIATATGEIVKKQLSVSGTTVASKNYDGTTTAVVTAPGSLNGVIGLENVSVTAAATYSDKTAGTGKQITVVYTLSGANATNYLAPANAALTGTITKATYNMGAVSFSDKTVTYNGTAQSLLITGTLPSGVSVSYTQNAKTDAGTYTATAHFTGDITNYNSIPDMSASLIITPLEMTGSVTLTGSPNSGETLTAVPTLTNAGPAPTYEWLRNDVLITGATNARYTLTEADIGHSIKVAINATAGNYTGQVVSSAVNISKALGPSLSGTFQAYYPTSPATQTIINLTGFTTNLAGLEAQVALNGTTYGEWADLEIDSRGRAMLLVTSAVTTTAKVQMRYKETTTAAGAVREISITEKALAIGDYYAGGVVAYIYSATNEPTLYISGQLHGLIAAKADTSPGGSKWSSNEARQIGTEIRIGTGSTNTTKIISTIDSSEPAVFAAQEAAAYTNGGYSDWFLPSFNELQKLRDSRTNIGNFNISSGSAYMSSSESSQLSYSAEKYYHAVFFDRDLDVDNVWGKTSPAHIRAVRYF
ncbi:MAG TPA: YDG domain-containing protein, partial [Sphaerochaeta sp.]|nr:YDG domain-containing protein [Sphaerochaeta sp.]